ncbi:hypothetical protein COF68_05200 [Bacillus toyonensis]|uniref:hypothetical protein n=1 Tax=Bacillus toyonensis TaxID=155322 RepID=UPI000BFD6A74|nr:hypothetical protein [Bacillus toyonensis]PHE64241.1 hypothetical protein COF68_05200 [Bacillus toyonensis]
MGSEHICHTCKKPTTDTDAGDSTPKDMVWCEGLTHEESRLIHLKCSHYDEGDWLCNQCRNFYERSIDMECQLNYIPHHDVYQLDFIPNEDLDTLKNTEDTLKKIELTVSGDRVEDWCKLTGITIINKGLNKLKPRGVVQTSFERVEDLPNNAVRCHGIDVDKGTIFYCYVQVEEDITIIHKPLHLKDMHSMDLPRNEIAHYYKEPFLGKWC